MRWITAVALLVLTAGCPKPLPPTPPGPPAFDGPATCADMCRHLAELGCPAARPTAEGATCEEVCENVQGSGLGTLDLNCLARATSCAAAETCEAAPPTR